MAKVIGGLTVKTHTKGREDYSEIITNIVDVLLGGNEFIERDDTISAQETVVGSSVKPWTRTSESAWWWVLVLMIDIARCWYLNVTNLTSW